MYNYFKLVIYMKISEILEKKRTLSFETFPPKKGFDDLYKTKEVLKEFQDKNSQILLY